MDKLTYWYFWLGEVFMMSTAYFLAYAFFVKCVLLSVYCGLIYLAICGIRCVLKLNPRASYNLWYILLLSLPLSSFGWNDGLKVSLYSLYYSPVLRTSVCAFGFVWLGFMCFCLMRQFHSAVEIKKRLAQASTYVDTKGIAKQAANAATLSSGRFEILVVDFIRSPVSYGVFKRFILLPDDFEQKYTDAELYLLLLHEMTHIKHHDTVKLRFMGLAECFVPVLRAVSSRFRQDCEMLCDNRVIGIRGDDVDAYGELMIRECSAQAAIRGLSFSDSYHAVKCRIEALYSFKPIKRNGAALTMLIAATLLLSGAWLGSHGSDWLVMCDAFNTEFTVFLYGDREDMNGYMLSPISDSICQASDGHLYVDTLALLEMLRPYTDEGIKISAITFETDSYAISGEGIHGGETYAYTMPFAELEQTENRYFVKALRSRGTNEYIYLFISHWL